MKLRYLLLFCLFSLILAPSLSFAENEAEITSVQNFTNALLEVLRGPLRVLFYVCAIIVAHKSRLKDRDLVEQFNEVQ